MLADVQEITKQKMYTLFLKDVVTIFLFCVLFNEVNMRYISCIDTD